MLHLQDLDAAAAVSKVSASTMTSFFCTTPTTATTATATKSSTKPCAALP